MASNATEYADSLVETIRNMADNGSPFGWLNSHTDEWSSDQPADWMTDAESDHLEDDEKPDTDWFEASAGDYLSDVLDIQYLVNSDRTYRSARILIAFGGPNAWIDTRTGQLEVAWWSAPEYRDLPSAFIDGLDDYLSEMWEMGA
jgi:hypothetical protein